MFTTLLISASPARCESMNRVAVESGKLTIVRMTTGYPAIQWLGSACRQFEPELVLLDLDDPASAMGCLREVQNRCPRTPILGIGASPAQRDGHHAAGVARFLDYPLQREALEPAVAAAIRSLDAQPTRNLYCFLPAKAGSGASTLALSTAAVLASTPEQRVLCLEADLRSGMLGEMAGVERRGSTQSALANAAEIDPLRWHNYVSRRYGVDFLLASPEPPQSLPQWSDYYQLLRFLQTRYETIIVDLPELVNSGTEEALRRARAVFLVTTQEPCALQLTKRRTHELTARGVPPHIIQVVVNAWNRTDIATEDIRKYLACPIAARIPEDRRGLRSALIDYQLPLPGSLAPGRAIRQFAERLAAGSTPVDEITQEPRWTSLRRLLAIGA